MTDRATEPTLALIKLDGEEPTLTLGGEPIPDDATVTWPAAGWAALINVYYQHAYKAGFQAGVEAVAEQGIQAGVQVGIDWAKANMTPPALTGPISIVSMPTRVTRRKVIRDKRGQIVETLDVQEDVT